jgi:hypothetical protein
LTPTVVAIGHHSSVSALDVEAASLVPASRAVDVVGSYLLIRSVRYYILVIGIGDTHNGSIVFTTVREFTARVLRGDLFDNRIRKKFP